MNLNEIVAVSAVRTPMGSFGGTLKDMPVHDVGATALRAAWERAGIKPDQIDEVNFGNCRQAGNGPNPARTAAVRGGVPISAPVTTINMACPSGMKCIQMASQAIRLGESRIVLVGGMDSMSTIPYLLKEARWVGFKTGDRKLEDGWSDSIDPLIGQGMGATAENLVEKWKISREEQDEFAANSHLKAARARKEGWFDNEIVPVEVPPASKKDQPVQFKRDETIRENVDREKMARLPPVFKKDGSVTAGNACGMSDGAAALVITGRETASALGAKPLFSIVSIAQAAVDPATMGEGPGVVIPIALKNAGMTLSDIDFIDVNEAFAVQVLVNQRMLNWNPEKLNVHGGAIALGHPTGISGARIVVTLYNILRVHNGETGLAAICGGGGVTMAMVIKREN